MKKIIETITNAFAARNTYNATMLIAGQQITVPVIAKDMNAALRQAEIIADDCGFVIDITM